MTGIRDRFDERKDAWFRDVAQRDRVRTIVSERLADDASQEECRYLVRFWWHLAMSYREVTYEQLLRHVSAAKMDVLEALFDAIDASHESVDAWPERCESEWPLIDEERTRRSS